MTERFEKAYTALTKAFFDGTLAAGHSAACAVGNIVSTSLSITLTPKEFDILIKPIVLETKNPSDMIMHAIRVMPLVFKADRITREWVNKRFSDELVAETGYTGKELTQVEKVFEENTIIPFMFYPRLPEEQIIADQYNGLVAAISKLAELDNIEGFDCKPKLEEHPLMTEQAKTCARHFEEVHIGSTRRTQEAREIAIHVVATV